MKVERRTLPGESATSVETELRAIAGDATVRTTFAREPLETAPDAEIVRAVSTSAARVLGEPPEVVGVPFWTDAALFASAGIPTVVFGPAGDGAHAETEWVDLDSAAATTSILVVTARTFCG